MAWSGAGNAVAPVQENEHLLSMCSLLWPIWFWLATNTVILILHPGTTRACQGVGKDDA
eukprot:CAMPEP_0115472000 /NCGR_PEP_ID=MMETSP0271-20121206/52816_1 /TAXON_ID=71861 /ORGANISM="Scrippsiella trochoidea, Strain CCMP3099" /LENGTH=58 /DNA_ID=CAMNT_0002899209 /DNA_START=9 /DNA_END=182 /DNA_ORIENTATION=-